MEPDTNDEAKPYDPDDDQFQPIHHLIMLEGMVVELSGCWFIVDQVRRNRMTLVPISYAHAQSRIKKQKETT